MSCDTCQCGDITCDDMTQAKTSCVAPSKCSTNAECGLNSGCVNGLCVPFKLPSLDCDGSCTSGMECILGRCVPTLPTRACEPACNADYGEKCDELVGVCIRDPWRAPTCNDCTVGLCRPAPFPGIPPVCLRPPVNVTSLQQCSAQSDCSSDTICRMGYCTRCGPICTALQSLGTIARHAIMKQLAAGGLSIDALKNFRPPALVHQLIAAGGVLSPKDGDVLQLNATLAQQIHSLKFNTSGGAAVQIGASESITTDVLSAGVESRAQLIVGARGELRSDVISVSRSAVFTLSLNGPKGSGVTDLTSVIMNRLNLSGPLNIDGDERCKFEFPVNDSDVVIASGGGRVQVSGGVALSGHAGLAPITIHAARSSVEMSFASVLRNDSFTVNGTLLGEAARFIVNGTFTFSGTVLEPKLAIRGLAKLVAAGKSIRTGNVSVQDGGRLSIDASSLDAGKQVFIERLEECDATATIHYEVKSLTAVRSSKGFVLFTYGVDTYSKAASFHCGIRVCEVGTDDCMVVTNPSQPEPTNARRRLFGETHDDATLGASWEPTQLSVSWNDPNAAASIQTSMIMLAVTALMAILLAKM